MKPIVHRSWYKLGNTLEELHCYEKAALAYSKALEMKQNDCESWYGCGYVLERNDMKRRSLTMKRQLILSLILSLLLMVAIGLRVKLRMEN